MSTPFKMNGISFKEGQTPAKKLNLKGSMAKMDLEAIESVATSLMDVDKGSGPSLEKVDESNISVNTEDSGTISKSKKTLSSILGGINAFMDGFGSTQGSKENN